MGKGCFTRHWGSETLRGEAWKDRLALSLLPYSGHCGVEGRDRKV
jgi:hypothetical protein